MKALDFAIWLRDEVGVIRHSKEGSGLEKPSNGELRRWLKKGSIMCNREILTADSWVEWPIINLTLFPNNAKIKASIV